MTGLRAPSFLRYFFWEQNVMRFLQPFDHPQPIWYYAPIVLGGLLPGTLLLWGFARYLSRETTRKRLHKRSPALWVLVAGGRPVVSVLFFSVRVQIAHVHSSGISLFGAGAGRLCCTQQLASHNYRQIEHCDHSCPSGVRSLLRSCPGTLSSGRRWPIPTLWQSALLRRSKSGDRLLSPQRRFSGLLPGAR